MIGRWLCGLGRHRWMTISVIPGHVLSGHGGRLHEVQEQCARCRMRHSYTCVGVPRRVRA